MDMLVAANEALDGNYSRYLMVNELDEENLNKAKNIFERYRKEKILLNERFSDAVWEINDEKRTVKLRFDFSETAYYASGREWMGCSFSCFRDSAKAYIAFQLGTLGMDSLCSITNTFRKLAESDAGQVAACKENVRHAADFLKMLPQSTQLRDTVLESLEESLSDHYQTRTMTKQRRLADFQAYFRFHDELEKYWRVAGEKEKLFFFPIYLWWNLTAVLPLRPTEFLLTPRDCLEERDGESWITIRRTRLKGGTEKVAYRIEKDYERKSYPIQMKLADEIRQYRKWTMGLRQSEIHTLFCPETHCHSGFGLSGKQEAYYTYVNLLGCLRLFYKEVLKDTDISVIQLGDTRHIAMMNLIISGGSPVICKELAGHADIDISSHYYSNMATLVECATFEMFRRNKQVNKVSASGSREYDIQPVTGMVRLEDGWCRSELMRDRKVSDCLENVNEHGEIGECHDCRFYRPDTQGMHFQFWDVKKGKRQVQADSWYLMHMVELVRKGAGYEEDIKSALMRLQSSCNHYRGCLLKEYGKEGT
ncbi:MAG: hypothetical protein ACRC3H_21735 [Lachnospiraceae bacterium]